MPFLIVLLTIGEVGFGQTGPPMTSKIFFLFQNCFFLVSDPHDILLNRHTLHVVMPETADTTLYFWAMANSATSLSEEQEGLIYDRSLEAFNEDIVIIEGQQARRAPAIATVDISADAGPLAVRRLMERMIAGQEPNSRIA